MASVNSLTRHWNVANLRSKRAQLAVSVNAADRPEDRLDPASWLASPITPQEPTRRHEAG